MGKIKTALIFILSGTLFLCFPEKAPAQQPGGYTAITPGELKKLLDSDKKALLVDTQSISRYQQEHIAGARHFEFPNEEMSRWDKSKTGMRSEEDFKNLLGPDKDRPIIFYCQDPK